ncbi:TPA: chemotaxis-inhibiting protein CHIPS [Staphylococcus aureus]
MRKSRIIQTGVATCILATGFLTYTDKANAEVANSTFVKLWLHNAKNNEKAKDMPEVKHATTLGEIDKRLRATIKNKDFKKMVIQTETGAYYTVDLTQPLAEDRKKVVLDGKMYKTGLFKQNDERPSKFIYGPGKKPVITFRPGI